jgi:hypothetical protein
MSAPPPLEAPGAAHSTGLPEPPVAPTPPPLPAAGTPPTPPPPPSEPGRPPLAAFGDFVRRIDPRIGLVVLAILVIGGGLIALGSVKSSPKPRETQTTTDSAALEPTATATAAKRPKPTVSLRAQVLRVDGLLRLSQKGRAAAVRGDFAGAIANRTTLLKDLQALGSKARNAQLKSGLTAFAAALTEALHQNRTCRSKCSATDIAKVRRLKDTAVHQLNPLLHRFGAGRYSATTI